MSTTMLNARKSEGRQQRLLRIFSYLILLVSLSAYGFWQAVLPIAPASLILGQMGVLAVLLLVAQLWPVLRPLRHFILIALLVNAITGWLIPLVRNTSLWAGWFGTTNLTFWQANAGELFLKLATTLLVIALLLIAGFRRTDFFLVKGQLDAPVQPVRGLGMKTGQPWSEYGRNFALLTFIIILAATLLPNLARFGLDSVGQALPLLPAALLFAAMNSIYEEVVFRAAFLAPLVPVIGQGHALAITILLFGLGHLTGAVPSGIVGVLLAGFFALVIGKAMLETKGIVWPWICHFAADTAVFIFLAIATTAGAIQ
ncbi:MAG: CPBP family intramembrane metalloprotease [Anaerolineaceae bacterium]|nr:CPBP family intramembrane metalloprotease [Anaerolineaceae bacterium]